MITSDEGLQLVREQLARVDAIIEDMRKTILPKSERMYNLFVESTLDLKESLQADIDDYLARTTRPAGDPPTPAAPAEAPAADRV